MKLKSAIVLLLLLLFMPGFDVKAAYNLSLEKVQPLSSSGYAFGDIAAARLSAYGILDDRFKVPQEETGEPISRFEAVNLLYTAFGEEPQEKYTPFIDIHQEDAIAWAYQNGLVYGTSSCVFDGMRNITKNEFITILLRYLGYYDVSWLNPMEMWDSLRFDVVGESAGFTLGDAALYIDAVLHIAAADSGISVSKFLKIDTELPQIPFPQKILLQPTSAEVAEAQLMEAIQYVPLQIVIDGESLDDSEFLEMYKKYRWEQYTIENYSYETRAWYDVATTMFSSLNPKFEIPNNLEELYPEHVFYDERAELYQQYRNDDITWEFCEYQIDLKEAEYFRGDSDLVFRAYYNEAWILACDTDPVFTAYVDDTISDLADSFYKDVLGKKNLSTEYDIVMAAKQAIVAKARYDSPIKFESGVAVYSDDSHTAEGFFEDGRIVCDGYACVFQYLMLRAGIPCIEVFGSIESQKKGDAGDYDHAWNKVLINENWYNMDICWADTGYPTTFDLKSDQTYRMNRH